MISPSINNTVLLFYHGIAKKHHYSYDFKVKNPSQHYIDTLR